MTLWPATPARMISTAVRQDIISGRTEDDVLTARLANDVIGGALARIDCTAAPAMTRFSGEGGADEMERR